jgi:putative DNA primase/helicase
MTDPLDPVRRVMAEPEDVDMGGVPSADDFPEDQGDHPDDGWEPDFDGPTDQGPPPDGDEPGPVERAAQEPMNDVGNGRRFVIHFGEDIHYLPGLGWYVWQETHWERDEHGLAVRAKAQALHPLIEQETAFLRPRADLVPFLDERNRLRVRFRDLSKKAEADKTPDEIAEHTSLPGRIAALDKQLDGFDKSIARRMTFAKDTGNSGRIDKLMQEAQGARAVAFEDLDADPVAVNCIDGLLKFETIDMGEEGGGKVARVSLIPHARDQLVTKRVPVGYDPAAPAPLWQAFMERIQPDREMRAFLQRWFGLSMTALDSSNLAFLYGGGANGKSVLVDTIARVLAGYSASLRIESITGTNRRGGAEATPDLIPLMGSRFVRTSEPDHGTPLQEGLIKQMTGGEPISVRPMYGAQIDIDPTWKITMSGNHKPDIRGTDDGIWRRVLLVPFDVQIPREERDERFGEKLWAERAGIFAWLVEGLLSYLEIGLQPPQTVREATDEYREESDPLGTFLTTCCVVTGDPKDSILSQRVVEAVQFHFLERGLTGWRATTITKGFAVKSRQWRNPGSGKRFEKSKASRTQYIGLRLTDEFARRLDEHLAGQKGYRGGGSAAGGGGEDQTDF